MQQTSDDYYSWPSRGWGTYIPLSALYNYASDIHNDQQVLGDLGPYIGYTYAVTMLAKCVLIVIDNA